MDAKPIPAFYCCYLLRSTVQRAFNYIGSTPNMVRRLRQHNGESKGGAKRTSRKTLKPWEVACIVHGFPSKIAALQFEWAWQHTYKSRHARDDNEGLLTNLDFRVSPKSGKIRKRKPTTQARSLTDRITNLHILLRAQSFERWPLSIRFFTTDVYRVWKAVDEKLETKIPQHFDVVLDEFAVDHYDHAGSKNATAEISSIHKRLPLNGVENLDFGYLAMKDYVEKSKAIVSAGGKKCAVCASYIRSDDELLLICEHGPCSAVSHLNCLSRHFVGNAGLHHQSMLPVSSSCPSCKKQSRWETLVKELSLRTRGEKELVQMFKKRRVKKGDAGPQVAAVDDEILTTEELEEQTDDEFMDLEEFEAKVIEGSVDGVSGDFVDVDEYEYETGILHEPLMQRDNDSFIDIYSFNNEIRQEAPQSTEDSFIDLDEFETHRGKKDIPST